MENNKPSVERVVTAKSGWLMLVFNLGLIPLGIAMVIVGIIMIVVGEDGDAPGLILLGILLIIGGALTEVAAAISLFGHFTLQPNEARVLLLFGEYRGTVRRSGFYWANPFYSRKRGGSGIGNIQVAAAAAKTGQPPTVNLHSRFSTKISLRAQTLNGDQLKVNDKRGNPIEIAAMVIWRVEETAKAVFDVEDYVSYVATQSESALRHLATDYPYDHGEEDEPTLRGSVDEVSEALKKELQVRLDRAGLVVEEARITHLAYAPEIAEAMLRRQQAEAIIAARKLIVQGAVSMVEIALRELGERKVVELDDERKAAMVSNLLVVLCSESETSPVINAGTLYQ